MPLKYQILISPFVIILVLIGLVWFTLAHYANIRLENENVRQWGRITDRMQIAISAGQRMESIAHKMISASSDESDDLQFNYLEQYRIFSESVLYPECVDKLSGENRQFIQQLDQSVTYDDNLNPNLIQSNLHSALPRLESIYNSFYVQKRGAYIDFYDYFNEKGSQLITVLISGLTTCVFLALALSFWTINSIRSRLQILTDHSKAICHGKMIVNAPPVKIRDELDELSQCLAKMTERLINTVAIEKVLEGAEEERRRIAMDIHDESLATLTGVIRNLDGMMKIQDANSCTPVSALQEVREDLALLLKNLRNIIDDLHPQTLEILGLEPTIRSFLEKLQKTSGMPAYSLHAEKNIEQVLTRLEKLYFYRITLEAVSNILRHAQCERFEIVFRILNDDIVLTIEDNGIGFDQNFTVINNGHGVNNIIDRAKVLGAAISWGHSRFSTGTKLECRLPFSMRNFAAEQ